MTYIEKQLKLDNFSWSLRRQYYFNSCKLAYLFQYHFAHGGHSRYASDSCQQLYRLKHLQHADNWLYGIVSAAIRATFNCGQIQSNATTVAETLQQHAFEIFRHDWVECKLKAWQQDAKTINIFEIYYAPQIEMKIMFNSWLKRLEYWLKAFIANSLFHKLCQLDNLDWWQFDTPSSFNINNIPVWVNPLLAWHDHEYGAMLLLRHNNSNELAHLETAIGSLLISQHSHLAPPTQEIMLYMPGNDDIFIRHPTEQELRACRTMIIQSSAKMQNFEAALAAKLSINGQKSTYCNNCKFKEFCQEHNYFVDGIQ
jgi:transposase-like protein